MITGSPVWTTVPATPWPAGKRIPTRLPARVRRPPRTRSPARTRRAGRWTRLAPKDRPRDFDDRLEQLAARFGGGEQLGGHGGLEPAAIGHPLIQSHPP